MNANRLNSPGPRTPAFLDDRLWWCEMGPIRGFLRVSLGTIIYRQGRRLYRQNRVRRLSLYVQIMPLDDRVLFLPTVTSNDSQTRINPSCYPGHALELRPQQAVAWAAPGQGGPEQGVGQGIAQTDLMFVVGCDFKAVFPFPTRAPIRLDNDIREGGIDRRHGRRTGHQHRRADRIVKQPES